MTLLARPTTLEAREVTVEFGGLVALSRFSLRIGPRDLGGLIGPNGAGKTTAFNVLTGVYQPTSGEVHVGGAPTAGLAPFRVNRLGVARTFQNIRLFRALSVLDNVRVACLSGSEAEGGSRPAVGSARARVRHYADWWRAMLRTPGFLAEEAAIEARARALLEVVGLDTRAAEEAGGLPYGEQRRLEIARALGTRPGVLLLDEPAAGMNSREKVDLMGMIRRLRDDLGLGVLVIEHDMKLVMGICESLTVLDHGETIARGEPAEVRRDRRVIEAYLGEGAAGGSA